MYNTNNVENLYHLVRERYKLKMTERGRFYGNARTRQQSFQGSKRKK